jgi:hypothetical protein
MLFGMLVHPFYIAFVDGSLIMLSFIIKLDMVPTYVNVTSTCPSGYPPIISCCRILGGLALCWGVLSQPPLSFQLKVPVISILVGTEIVSHIPQYLVIFCYCFLFNFIDYIYF